MFTLTDSDRLSRRGFLTFGAAGLAAFGAAHLQAAVSERPSLLTGRSVVFVFQQGGPSQFETFDPKPEAPEGVRTLTGTVRTAVPDLHFGDSLPRLAAQARRLTVVRSFQTNNAEHNARPAVGPDTQGASLGALHSRLAGPVRPDSGMPTSAVLFPQSVVADVTRGGARGDLTATGGLGAVHAPFIPGAGGPLQRNMKLNLPRERLEDRRHLLAEFDRLARQLDTPGAEGPDRFHDQAYRLLLGGRVAEALDLTRESPAVVARYDTAGHVRPHNWTKATRGKRGYYTGQARSIGKLMLLARRLCEAGCGFVTVHADYEGVWDMHADGENLNMVDGMEAIGRPFDHAVAAFLDDLAARGLSEKILLVCCGEMGRTPKINKNGGRDHWARLAPLILAGGGAGRVVGSSTRDGGEPAGEPLGPRNLISTLLHWSFDVGQLRLVPALGSLVRLAEADPIPGIV